MNAKTISMPVGVVVRKTPGVTRWAKWNWNAVAVLPGAPAADWQEMRREGGAVEYHAATLQLDLFRSDTEAYLTGLSCEVPALYVVLQNAGYCDDPGDVEVLLVTASPYEAQDYSDSGEETVEPVPMPDAVKTWIWDFVDLHHTDEVFKKRRQDKKRTDLTEDGVGDARIRQASDVYRAPKRKASEFLQ